MELAARAREVADAWDDSAAAASWRQGFYPMADAVEPPAGGFRTDADQKAYHAKSFVLDGVIPSVALGEGTVHWHDGTRLKRPLISAHTAWTQLDQSSGSGPHLTVKKIKLGEMEVNTSRGLAVVPAWLFTLNGYANPLRRIAITPSALPTPPLSPLPAERAAGTRQANRLVRAPKDMHRNITVAVTRGACERQPTAAALETRQSIVVMISTLSASKSADPCSSEAYEERINIRLSKPIGERILLDAVTGRPVPYGQTQDESPTWS
ncbi:hypothetical protein [Streptomyces sp. NPDC047046]|uniref:hypothetical protein n=1 Tax=Streptomyces sp. NPDC047046 TaxID=3155378 RepID=UPI0034030C1A